MALFICHFHITQITPTIRYIIYKLKAHSIPTLFICHKYPNILYYFPRILTTIISYLVTMNAKTCHSAFIWLTKSWNNSNNWIQMDYRIVDTPMKSLSWRTVRPMEPMRLLWNSRYNFNFIWINSIESLWWKQTSDPEENRQIGIRKRLHGRSQARSRRICIPYGRWPFSSCIHLSRLLICSPNTCPSLLRSRKKATLML